MCLSFGNDTVAIIIGILAAIAIPMFICQRNQAREADAQSGLRNAVTTATARSADNTIAKVSTDAI
jgi:type IV pilus assembly protein PilA